MKSSLLPLVVCIIVFGGGAFAVLHKINSAPEEVREEEGWLGALLHREYKEKPITEADRQRMDQRLVEMKQSLLEEFPILKIEERPVPDEENGFLQILKLDKHPLAAEWEASGMWYEISYCMHEWDPEISKAFPKKYPSFIAEAKRIASLRSQSSTLTYDSNIDWGVHAKSAKGLHDLCMMQARMAAESGNESAALEAASDAMQIRNHLHDVETPTLLTETVVIVMDMDRMKWIVETLLPTLKASSDLGAWRELMGGEKHQPERLAEVIRGEWHSLMALESLLLENHHGYLDDPMETAQILSEQIGRWIAELEKKPSVGFRDFDGLEPVPDASSLSSGGQKMVNLWGSDPGKWFDGMLSSSVITAQFQAVLDILIHEREGRTIPEMIEPVSGLPFRFDESTRTLHAPEWDGAPENTPPVKLPW